MITKKNKRIGCATAVFVSLYAVMSFAAQNRNVIYNPPSPGEWEWGQVDNWYSISDNSKLGALPNSSKDEYGDVVFLVSPHLSDNPLKIKEGTSAYCYQLYIGAQGETVNGVECSDRPVCIEVCGGVVTNEYASYLGYVNNKWGPTRSAKVDITSGSWISLGDLNIGGGAQFSWLNIGKNGYLEVMNPTAGKGLNIGFANYGGGIVTNNGTIKAYDFNVGYDYKWGIEHNFATGIVYNAGSVTVTHLLSLGFGTNAVAHLENRGTIDAKEIYAGGKSNAVSMIDNYGSLAVDVKDGFMLGYSADAGISTYRHHPGATLTNKFNEGGRYYVGYKAPSVFTVDGGTLNLSNKDRIYIAGGQYATATNCRMEIVNGGKVKLNGNSITVGLGPESEGKLIVDGEGSELSGSLWLNVGNWTSLGGDMSFGRGEIVVDNKGKLRPSAIYLGFGGGAIGKLSVMNGGTVTTDTLTLGRSGSPAKGLTSTGMVVIAGTGSVVTNVNTTSIGSISNDGAIKNTGFLHLKGGKYFLRTGASGGCFKLGVDGNSSHGEIRGWGQIAHNGIGTVTQPTIQYMDHFGKVIADGEGEERDLNMRFMWSVGDSSVDPNEIGCNGWYARNKGRLRFPILYNVKSGYMSHCVGDYVYHGGNPRLVNSFKYTFSDVYSTQRWLWADLYATDRSDIPAGLTSRVGTGRAIAVYRMGYFDNKYHFGEPDKPYEKGYKSAHVQFHYSPDEAKDYPRVRVYHHDGTEGGSWRLSGEAVYSSENPFVTTAEFKPSEATWNFGWFAVVADRPRGTVINVR